MTDHAKRPLWSEDAEAAVLSAMLMDTHAVATARTLLPNPAAFHLERHRLIYGAMLALHDAGTIIDPLTLANHLAASQDLARVGGKDYVGFLMDAVPTSANIAYHAKIVREKAALRAILALLKGAEAGILDGGLDAQDAAQQVFNGLLTHAVSDPSATAGFTPIKDLVWPTMQAVETRAAGGSGVPTGYRAIDHQTNGFRPGELVILGGAEKSGKSATALNIARRVAMQGIGAAIVSAEMTSETVVERMLAAEGRIAAQAIASGRMQDDDWARLARASGVVAQLPLWIDDEAEPALADVAARASHLKLQHPEVKLIVVDFLQLVTAREKGVNEAVELKRVAYGLKALAKRLGVVVIAPCQVNSKEIEAGKDKRPELKDLQGSSGMRQAADFVGLVYRPGLYSPTGGDELELDFKACRRTASFTARLRWHGETMTVLD